MSDFLPRAEDALNTWLANLKKQLPIYAPALNISGDDVNIYQNSSDALINAILNVDDAQRQVQTKIKAKDELKEDTLSNIRTLANRIKTEKNYTESIGAALGITSSATVVDMSAAKPQLTVSLTGGQVIIAFKRGHSNGVKLYGKRGSETAFSFLALDTHSPYHDTRTNQTEGTPEIRQYYAFFIDAHDGQVGLQSDTVSITV